MTEPALNSTARAELVVTANDLASALPLDSQDAIRTTGRERILNPSVFVTASANG
jgi:hypothetical protein